MVGTFTKIGGGRLEDLPLKREMARKDKGRIIRHVQPLVAIDGDRVGCFQAAQQMRACRVAGGEEAERPIDMQPRPIAFAEFGQRREIVKLAGIYLARAGNHDRGRAMKGREALRGRPVDRPLPGLAKAEAAPHSAVPCRASRAP